MSERLVNYSGGLSPARGREAPCTLAEKVPPSGDAHKSNCSELLRLSEV